MTYYVVLPLMIQKIMKMTTANNLFAMICNDNFLSKLCSGVQARFNKDKDRKKKTKEERQCIAVLCRSSCDLKRVSPADGALWAGAMGAIGAAGADGAVGANGAGARCWGAVKFGAASVPYSATLLPGTLRIDPLQSVYPT